MWVVEKKYKGRWPYKGVVYRMGELKPSAHYDHSCLEVMSISQSSKMNILVVREGIALSNQALHKCTIVLELIIFLG